MPAPLKVDAGALLRFERLELVIAVVLGHDLGAERFRGLVERVGSGQVLLGEERPGEQLLGDRLRAPDA